MGVELIRGPEAWWLTLSGVVGIAEARELAAAARATLDGGARDVLVRLGDLRALDTSGAQVLLCLKRTLADQGRVMRLEGVSAAIVERWRRTGLDKELVGADQG